MKIASVVGARPNFVKMAPIHDAILASGNEHFIINTGQHYDYELSDIFFRDFQLPKPDIDLDVGSGSSCFQIGEILKRLETQLAGSNFDIVLVYGDTNSTLAGAISANKCGMKLGHVEAGLRSFDITMPEEHNRILTDHLSDYLFAPTKNAVRMLNREKVRGQIFYTGDLSVEIVAKARSIARNSDMMHKLGLIRRNYFLLTMHRASNTDSREDLLELLKSIKALDTKLVFPIHPRTKKAFQEFGLLDRLSGFKNVRLISAIGYIDFMALLENAAKVITDSGGIQKEAYLLKIPCITIRDNTEWIETLLGGWNILTGVDSRKIIKAIRAEKAPLKYKASAFGGGDTSHIITNILTSIT
jgi:UDP-N-acetylglucosamine 2-epimerase (non-hydrolysing)